MRAGMIEGHCSVVLDVYELNPKHSVQLFEFYGDERFALLHLRWEGLLAWRMFKLTVSRSKESTKMTT